MEKPLISIEDLISKINLIIESELCELEDDIQTFKYTHNEIKYPNSDRLIKLYNLTKNNQLLYQTFIEQLLKETQITSYNNKINPFPLIIYTSIRLNEIDLFIGLFTALPPLEIAYRFINTKWEILKKYFNQDRITILIEYCHEGKSIIQSMPRQEYWQKPAYPNSKKLYKKLIKEQVELLDEQLKDNFQYIKQDTDELIHKIKINKFEDKLISLVNHINELILNDPNEHTVAGEIGNFREAFRELIEQMAEKIRILEKDEEIPKITTSDTGNCRKYIKSKLGLSKKDEDIFSKFDKLLDSFINVTHKEGGHSYYTTPKSLKFIRNMGITLILHLIDCYDTYVLIKTQDATSNATSNSRNTEP